MNPWAHETNPQPAHINDPVPAKSLQQHLADLPRTGTLLKNRSFRQVWRFEFEGRAYYLKFYPKNTAPLKRLFRGSPAHREFERLTALQKFNIPAPKPVAEFLGITLDNLPGDAVVLEAIEPAVQLDEYLHGFLRRGQPIPNHRELAEKIRHILRQLKEAGLGHNDLHLGNFLLKNDQIFLLDGYAVHFGGLKMDDLLNLAHGLQGIATRTDLLRGWKDLGPDAPIPSFNPVSPPQWRKLVDRSRAQNAYFGKLQFGPWSGFFFKRYKYPRRWALASELAIQSQDWQTAWPKLWNQIESNQLEIIKTGPSGDVLGGEITLAGRTLPIVVKRPFKRYWYRYLNEIGRGSRAWRAWHKAWTLIVRGIPTAWPLMVLQKRSMGYITDALIIFERIPGPPLAAADLDAMNPQDRQQFFRRTGAILRQIDKLGIAHFDAKPGNWIVKQDPILGSQPILIDVDGIRFRRWITLGISRLLRGMLEHPQYTPADSLALCQGYAPFSSTLIQKETELGSVNR